MRRIITVSHAGFTTNEIQSKDTPTKTHLLITALLLFVAACSDQPIAQQLQGKTVAKQYTMLVNECEDEAWRGHDSGNHTHNLRNAATQAHVKNIKRICNALTKPDTDKKALLVECRAEAQNNTVFDNKRLLDEHNKRLREICDGFGQVK